MAVARGNTEQALTLLQTADDWPGLDSTSMLFLPSSGWHALHLAVAWDRPQIVAAILESGCDVEKVMNATDFQAAKDQQATVWNTAAQRKQLAVLQRQERPPKGTNWPTSLEGMTALMTAALADTTECAKVLLEWGADAHATAVHQGHQMTAEEMAAAEKNFGTAYLLSKTEEFPYAAVHGKIAEKAVKSKELAAAVAIQAEVDQLEVAIEDLEERAAKKRAEVRKLKADPECRTDIQMKDLGRKIEALEMLEAKVQACLKDRNKPES